MTSCYYLIGLRMDDRVGNALNFQELLTRNGCRIRARLGLHETNGGVCANEGLIVLQLCGEREDVGRIARELNDLEGVRAKLIDLN